MMIFSVSEALLDDFSQGFEVSVRYQGGSSEFVFTSAE